MNLNIQQIKLFIKASIIIGVLAIFIILGVFIRPTTTYENAHIKKWLVLSDPQRVATIERVIKDSDNQELLLKCVDKIANLPGPGEMLIRDAATICYGGIQMNAQNAQPDEK